MHLSKLPVWGIFVRRPVSNTDNSDEIFTEASRSDQSLYNAFPFFVIGGNYLKLYNNVSHFDYNLSSNNLNPHYFAALRHTRIYIFYVKFLSFLLKFKLEKFKSTLFCCASSHTYYYLIFMW